MIDHIIILFRLHRRPHTIRSVFTVQYFIMRRPHLHDRSPCFPISSLSQTTHCPIGLNNLISYSIEITTIQLVTLFSYLLFMIDHNCTISHIIVLSILHRRLYPIEPVTTIQFCFQLIADLYDRSHHCPVLSLSQTTHCSIHVDSSIMYSMEITLLQSITSLSCLPFMIAFL